MNKYIVLFQKAFIKSIEYRSEILIWLVLDTLPILILLLVWVGIYQTKDTIAGFGLSDMLQYYLLGMIIEGLTASHFEAWRVEQIKMGKIDYFLTRPISFLTEILLVFFGGKAFYLFVSMPLFLLVWYLTSLIFSISLPIISIIDMLSIFVLLFLAALFQAFIALIIVLLGFWFEGAQGLEHFKWIVLSIFTGLMIPIPFMPQMIQHLIYLLPFKYLYAVPIGIVQGTYQLRIIDWSYLVATIVFLYVVILLIWNRAQYKYSSAGG